MTIMSMTVMMAVMRRGEKSYMMIRDPLLWFDMNARAYRSLASSAKYAATHTRARTHTHAHYFELQVVKSLAIAHYSSATVCASLQ